VFVINNEQRKQLQIKNGTVSLKFGGIGHKKLISRESLLKDEKAVNEGYMCAVYVPKYMCAV
jgi:hypothetical protein